MHEGLASSGTRAVLGGTGVALGGARSLKILKHQLGKVGVLCLSFLIGGVVSFFSFD